ncbi:hypothetical protein Btru_072606 [Bulinus truncatus]|nr:hypothetical protein Btru_072606 [Bulinus truncatus]
MKSEEDVSKRKTYDRYAKLYQNMAIDILKSCYREDSKLTSYVLIKEIPEWRESCITIAIKTENKQFLQQTACSDVNRVAWRTYLGQHLDFTTIGYLLFLTAYSLVLVSYLSINTFHFLEAVVMAYMLILYFKELDQCCSSLRKKFQFTWQYFADPFNIIDLISIAFSVIGWTLRWTAYILPDGESWMTASRYILSFDFMLYMFRFLEFFYQNKFLGPILIVIRHMVKTFLYFFLILLIFLVAYSVASQSVMYPETQLNPSAVYTIFHHGFWAMVGDYGMDDFTEHDCTSDPLLYNNNTMRRCPSKSGEYFVPALLCVYAIFVQILMFNLLIALFTNSITENENQRDQIWSFQTFQITMQYSATRVLLPPFLVLFFWLKSNVGNPFRSPVCFITLDGFEHSAGHRTIQRARGYSLGIEVLDKDKRDMIKYVLTVAQEVKDYAEKDRPSPAAVGNTKKWDITGLNVNELDT